MTSGVARQGTPGTFRVVGEGRRVRVIVTANGTCTSDMRSWQGASYVIVAPACEGQLYLFKERAVFGVRMDYLSESHKVHGTMLSLHIDTSKIDHTGDDLSVIVLTNTDSDYVPCSFDTQSDTFTLVLTSDKLSEAA